MPQPVVISLRLDRLVSEVAARVKHDQVDLAAQAAEEINQPIRVLGGVVDAFEQDVLDRQSAAGFERVAAEGVHQLADRPAAVDGHDR